MTDHDYVDGGYQACHHDLVRISPDSALFVEFLADAVEAADDYAVTECHFRGLLWPNPVAPRETELMVQTGRNCFNPRIIERIDLTAPDADARLARYVETGPG